MTLIVIALVVIVVLAAAALLTRGRIFWILIIPAVAWLLVLVFNLSWWVLFWAAIAAVLLVAWTALGAMFIAIIAVVAILAAGYVAFYGSNESRLAAYFTQSLVDNNKVFTLDESCVKPELKPLCDELTRLNGRVDTTETRLDIVEKRLGIIEMETTEETVIKSDGGLTDEEAAKALAKVLAAAGWGPDDLTINRVDEEMHSEQAGSYPFRERIKTKSELIEYLNGKTPTERANRNLVLSEVPKDQHSRLLRGEGYYALQFTKDSCLTGNSFFKNGKATLGGTTCHKKGDVLWIYVGNDGKIYWGATVRDDCGNGYLKGAPKPRERKPSTPSTPSAPRTSSTPTPGSTTPPTTPTTTHPTTPPTSTPSTTTKPTCPPGMHGTWPVCKDDPSEDNAGNGGGQNQDPGPGSTTTPTQPPETPRTNPATPTEGSGGTATSQPAPDPEPSAPPASNPATGCAPAPGETTCD